MFIWLKLITIIVLCHTVVDAVVNTRSRKYNSQGEIIWQRNDKLVVNHVEDKPLPRRRRIPYKKMISKPKRPVQDSIENALKISEQQDTFLNDVPIEVFQNHWNLNHWKNMLRVSKQWNIKAKETFPIFTPDYRMDIVNKCGKSLMEVFKTRWLFAENHVFIIYINSLNTQDIVSSTCINAISNFCKNQRKRLRIEFSGDSFQVLDRLSHLIIDKTPLFSKNCDPTFMFWKKEENEGIRVDEAVNLATALSRNIKMQSLSLAFIYLTRETAEIIGIGLSKNSHITELDFEIEQMDDQTLIAISNFLPRIVGLKSLEFAMDAIDPDHEPMFMQSTIQLFAAALAGCRNLNRLVIADFQISDDFRLPSGKDAVDVLIESIGTLSQLEVLRLELILHLNEPLNLDPFWNLHSLKTFHFSQQFVMDGNLLVQTPWSDLLNSLPNLQSLTLENVQFASREDFLKFCIAIANHEHLESLQLDDLPDFSANQDNDNNNNIINNIGMVGNNILLYYLINALLKNKSIVDVHLVGLAINPEDVSILYYYLDKKPQLESAHFDFSNMREPRMDDLPVHLRLVNTIQVDITRQNLKYFEMLVKFCEKSRWKFIVNVNDVLVFNLLWIFSSRKCERMLIMK